MSKELEAYFKIDHTLCLNSQNIKFGIDVDEHIDCRNVDELTNCLETIREALNELESIKEANPSEALECLERICVCARVTGLYKKEDEDVVKQALLKAQEQEKFFDDMLVFKNGCMMSCFGYKGKQIVAMPLEEYDRFMKQEEALEIIKEKDVDIYILRKCKTVDEYNFKIVHIVGETRELTQEEFKLLKEVLENEQIN